MSSIQGRLASGTASLAVPRREFLPGREPAVGERIYSLAAELYSICRSISGDGLRRSLKIVGEKIPWVLTELPSGTQVFDWTIPREWNIVEAYLEHESGSGSSTSAMQTSTL